MLILDRNVHVTPDMLTKYIRMGLTAAMLNVESNPTWGRLSYETLANGHFVIRAERSTSVSDRYGVHSEGLPTEVGYITARQHNAMTSRVQIMSQYIGDGSSYGADPYISEVFHSLTWYILEQVEGEDKATAWMKLRRNNGVEAIDGVDQKSDMQAGENLSLPKRGATLNRWKATWRAIRPMEEKAVPFDEIISWLENSKDLKHLACHRDTLEKIIKAGKAGKLD